MRPGCWIWRNMTSWSAPCRAFHSATRRSSVRLNEGPIRSGWRRASSSNRLIGRRPGAACSSRPVWASTASIDVQQTMLARLVSPDVRRERIAWRAQWPRRITRRWWKWGNKKAIGCCRGGRTTKPHPIAIASGAGRLIVSPNYRAPLLAKGRIQRRTGNHNLMVDSHVAVMQ